MWNSLRSYVIWLHKPEHVARFQQYFGILPKTHRPPDLFPTIDDENLNKNNNNNNNNALINDETEKMFSMNGIHRRHFEGKRSYDTNVLDECMEEIKHNTNPSEHQEEDTSELDYKITSWFWYYFFQFGAALGNEIFYILFFPTW